MLTPKDIVEYLGLPWIAGERDCWIFFRHLSEKFYGRTIPEVDVDVYDIKDVIRKVDSEKQLRWEQIAEPEDGCAVLMTRSRFPIHIGMWVDLDGGKVLHCAQGMGVVFQNRQALAFDGFAQLSFWRLK